MLSSALAIFLAVVPASVAGEKMMLTPDRAGHAVLVGTPPRTLTDPRTVVSEVRRDAHPLPLADVLALRSSYFATWTPDGHDIIFATDLTGRINLWRTSSTGGFPQQLQESEDKAFYPAVSPDGKTLLYASDRGGREIYDIFAMPADGGPQRNLTSSDDASETGPFIFSPDSRLIAFNRRVAAEPSTNIAAIPLRGGPVRLLTSEKEPGIYWRAVAFTPDGRSIIANRGNAGDTASSVWQIDVATGRLRQLLVDAGPYAAAKALSPDGRSLSVTVENPAGMRQAILADLSSGRRTAIAASDWPQEAGAFAPDGRSVLAVTNANGSDEIILYDLAAKAVHRLDVPAGKSSDYFGLLPAFSPNGTRLLLPFSSASAPFDYWIYDLASGTRTPVTRLALASVRPEDIPPSRIVNYKSADGTVISALLWMPFNLARDGSAPVVVLAHGGPTGQTFNNLDPTAVALASRGYIVIAPNVRGSTGYGRYFEQANRQDLGGRDLEDEAWAAKFLVESGFADPKKIGITGGSYGGFMTLMAVARMPDFWAAAVEEYGIVNWRSMWERGSPALREYQRGLIGDPAVDKAVYDRTSPLTYLNQVKAPLLVLQGENDIRVPKYEAEQIVSQLKNGGKIVDAHYYPEEGHGFVKRENQLDALHRTVDWFDRYLKGQTR